MGGVGGWLYNYKTVFSCSPLGARLVLVSAAGGERDGVLQAVLWTTLCLPPRFPLRVKLSDIRLTVTSRDAGGVTWYGQ